MVQSALAATGKVPADVTAIDLEKHQYSQTGKRCPESALTIVNTLQGVVVGFGLFALLRGFGIINTSISVPE